MRHESLKILIQDIMDRNPDAVARPLYFWAQLFKAKDLVS